MIKSDSPGIIVVFKSKITCDFTNDISKRGGIKEVVFFEFWENSYKHINFFSFLFLIKFGDNFGLLILVFSLRQR